MVRAGRVNFGSPLSEGNQDRMNGMDRMEKGTRTPVASASIDGYTRPNTSPDPVNPVHPVFSSAYVEERLGQNEVGLVTVFGVRRSGSARV